MVAAGGREDAAVGIAKHRSTHVACIAFDIETGPLSEPEIRRIAEPFGPDNAKDADGKKLKHPGTFIEDKVKIRNLKDRVKIADKIMLEREKHARAVETYDDDLAKAESSYWAGVIERAPLRAELGRVLAIGFYAAGKSPQICSGDEADVLRLFWQRFERCAGKSLKLVGFNSNGFDLPFIARRSYLLGLPVPAAAMQQGRYWCDTFIDLLDIWRAGNRQDTISLDRLSKAFGLAGKTGSGAMFHKLWAGTEKQRAEAEAYLVNDLELTWKCAERLGLVMGGGA